MHPPTAVGPSVGTPGGGGGGGRCVGRGTGGEDGAARWVLHRVWGMPGRGAHGVLAGHPTTSRPRWGARAELGWGTHRSPVAPSPAGGGSSSPAHRPPRAPARAKSAPKPPGGGQALTWACARHEMLQPGTEEPVVVPAAQSHSPSWAGPRCPTTQSPPLHPHLSPHHLFHFSQSACVSARAPLLADLKVSVGLSPSSDPLAAARF